MSRTPRNRARPLIAILCAACLLSACNLDWGDLFTSHGLIDDGGDTTVGDTDVAGLAVAASDYDFDTTLDRVVDAEPATRDTLASAIARIDLASRADRPPASEESGIDLRPTTVLRFSETNRALALINADRRAALDLPAAVLVYRDSQGNTGLAYNDASYWRARFALGTADDALDGLVADLRRTVTQAAGNDVDGLPAAGGIARGAGVARETSDADFDTTVSRLASAIDANRSVARIGAVDWAAAARRTGTMIGDNDDRLTVYFLDAGENAARLVAGNQAAGIDLPVRIAVSEDDSGEVTLYYTRPSYLRSRYDIDGRDDDASGLNDILSTLVDRAAGS